MNSWQSRLLLCTSLLAPSACGDELGRRASDEQREGFSCRIVWAEVEFADGTHEGHWSCTDGPEMLMLDPEFEDQNRERLGSGQALLHVGVAPSELRSDRPIAPELLELDDVEDMGGEDRALPANDGSRATGTRDVLVVRVLAPGGAGSHPFDEPTLARRVFGGADDQVNLDSQYAACSHGALGFEPAERPGATDGVVTVQLDTPLEGLSARAVTHEARKKLDANLETQHDHVMYCLPPGVATNNGWIAFAYMNHSVSVYNAEWCGSVTAQMHEFGHNIGLGHSGDGNNAYADGTCTMGFSHKDHEGPRLCFNGARSSQLGWYSDEEETISQSTDATYELRGIADYHRVQDGERVLLRITNPEWEGKAVHVAYNAAKGPAAGSPKGRNMVTVVESGETSGARAHRRAFLEVGEVYSAAPFGMEGSELAVSFERRTDDDVAEVRVLYSSSSDPGPACGAQTVAMSGAPYSTMTDGDYERVAEYGGAPVYQKTAGGYTWSLYRRQTGRWVLDFDDIGETWSGTVDYTHDKPEVPWDGSWNTGSAQCR